MALQDTRGNSLAGFWTLPEIDSCWRSAQPLNDLQIVSLLRIDHKIFYGQLSFGGLAELSSVLRKLILLEVCGNFFLFFLLLDMKIEETSLSSSLSSPVV